MNRTLTLSRTSGAQSVRMGRRQRRLLLDVASYGVLTAGAAIVLFPFFWMLVTSFKPLSEVRIWPPTILPQTFTVSNYVTIWKQYPFANFMENGFIIADFTRDGITVRYFRFNYHQQQADVIDTLEPFRVTELKRPS